jgi:hypothetical protein
MYPSTRKFSAPDSEAEAEEIFRTLERTRATQSTLAWTRKIHPLAWMLAILLGTLLAGFVLRDMNVSDSFHGVFAVLIIFTALLAAENIRISRRLEAAISLIQQMKSARAV